MQSISNNTFGPLIAYLVPGATVLMGLSPFVPSVQTWLATSPGNAPTIGGFLYLTVASLAVGMTVSAVRWRIVDTLHACTGLPAPPLNFSRLGSNVEAMQLLIESHYRHYQFYSNMLVATAIAFVLLRIAHGFAMYPGFLELGFVILEGVFAATSRDTLRKYYRRAEQLLGSPSPRRR